MLNTPEEKSKFNNYLKGQRQALLMQVDYIEKYLGYHTTTAAMRKMYKNSLLTLPTIKLSPTDKIIEE